MLEFGLCAGVVGEEGEDESKGSMRDDGMAEYE